MSEPALRQVPPKELLRVAQEFHDLPKPHIGHSVASDHAHMILKPRVQRTAKLRQACVGVGAEFEEGSNNVKRAVVVGVVGVEGSVHQCVSLAVEAIDVLARAEELFQKFLDVGGGGIPDTHFGEGVAEGATLAAGHQATRATGAIEELKLLRHELLVLRFLTVLDHTGGDAATRTLLEADAAAVGYALLHLQPIPCLPSLLVAVTRHVVLGLMLRIFDASSRFLSMRGRRVRAVRGGVVSDVSRCARESPRRYRERWERR